MNIAKILAQAGAAADDHFRYARFVEATELMQSDSVAFPLAEQRLAGLTKAGMTPDGKPGIGVKVSIGSSRSESQSSEDQTTQRGSSVQAGSTAAFVATNGDLTIAGSNMSANDVVLAAKDKVNVINTTHTDSTRSSNSSSSASVGVQYTAGGGFAVSAAMSNAHGNANSDASIQNASHMTGANSVTVVSGGDTNITGSQIAGKQITAEVGGNLNIASVQDVTDSAAHQSSAGGGFTIMLVMAIYTNMLGCFATKDDKCLIRRAVVLFGAVYQRV